MPSKRRKGKQSASRVSTPTPSAASATDEPEELPASVPPVPSTPSSPGKKESIVLTSDKRRGVYECDYCHADVSQVPRIRCAVCPDFDLCLDCFATVDHSAAVSRFKAAATAHGAVQDQGPTPGISASAANHDETHPYRVCDSTRYPLFPSSRIVSKEFQSLDSMSNYDADERPPSRSDEKEEAKEEEAKNDEKMDGNGEEEAKEKEADEGKPEASQETTPGEGERESQDVVMEEAKEKSREEVAKASAEDAPEDPKELAVSEYKEAPRDESKTEAPQDSVKETESTEPTCSGDRRPIEVEAQDKDEAIDIEASKENMASSATESEFGIVVQDDPRTFWTVEEDLRLLDAIKTFGLGNWADIAEAISGQGSTSKTAKRCMERYFDDFLGRYGQILPPFTFVEDEDDADGDEDGVEAEPEPKKRRLERMSSFGVAALLSGKRSKRMKAVPTSSLPGYESVWPDPFLPPNIDVQVGHEVGRDQKYRAEQLFVKLITSADTKEEADQIRKEWTETRLNQPNGPTALPIRPEDLPSLPGSDLAGFMPRRCEFDMEWENDAENVLADMEFSASDLPQDRELKIKVIQIYNSKLDERERRKNFLLSRGLLDYRKSQQAEARLPRDERDLVRRMRHFERFHTPEEHKQFIDDILKAKRLRKEIALLQMYRRIGIRTLDEAEKYENDKKRRDIHKLSQLQKEAEAEKPEVPKTPSVKENATSQSGEEEDATFSLWKQYRTSGRKNRRSINRTSPGDAGASLEKHMNQENGPSAPQQSADAEGAGSQVAQSGEAEEGPIESSASTAVDTPGGNTMEGSEVAKDGVGGDEKKTEANDDAMQVDVEQNEEEEAEVSDKTEGANDVEINGGGFSIAGMAGYDLLSKTEAALCTKLELRPMQYVNVKKAIIQESFRRGLLDNEDIHFRTIVTIDVEKRGDVVDFMVKAGWIPSKVGETIKQE